MINILIDNKDLKSVYGITVLDYSSVLGFASERENAIQWADKSGIDKNLENIRYETKEFYLECYCKAANELAAYAIAKTLVDYLFLKGVVVMSLRDTANNLRESFLVQRSSTLVPTINVRQQNSLYRFKIGFVDVNPNAVKYKKTIAVSSVSVDYTKGQVAVIFWGDGSRDEVSNSGTYTKSNYTITGDIDIIIDVDSSEGNVTALVANFTADNGVLTTAIKPAVVNFTDASTGGAVLWSWNFGDGNTSSEQSPSHTYSAHGTYTVTLQVFNSAQGSDTEIKTNYITIRDAYLLINNTDRLLINATNKLLKN